MQVWIARVDPKTHRFVARRPPHHPVDVVLETRSLLHHDFAHYAVESTLQIEDGFFGLVAAGADATALREHRMPPEEWAALMAIEREVALLQTAFKQGPHRPDDRVWERLRALHGAWSKVRTGEALALSWPAGEPVVQVVPAPPAPAMQDGSTPRTTRTDQR